MYEFQTVWGWQPALYLFLGGLGAGAFAVAALAYLKDRDAAHRKAASIVSWIATGCLAVGLLLLLTELTAPLRAFAMWQSFGHGSSWMAIGAWLLALAMVVFVLAGASLTDPLLARMDKKLPKVANFLRKACMPLLIAGTVLGVCVAAYTGVLLMSADGVALWNTPLLPCLFTVSAIGTGLALYELVAFALAKRCPATAAQDETPGSGHKRDYIQIAVVVFAVLEACFLAAFTLVALNTDGAANVSAQALVSGQYALPFWGLVVLCALAVPLICATTHVVAGKLPAALSVLAPLCALAGGCALRFVIVFAGAHADPVYSAILSIFS